MYLGCNLTFLMVGCLPEGIDPFLILRQGLQALKWCQLCHDYIQFLH